MTSQRFKRTSQESMRSSCSWRRLQRNKANNLQIWPKLLDHRLRHQRPSNRLLAQINLASCTLTDSWMRTLSMLLRSNLRSKSMSSQTISQESWLRDRSFLSTMKNRGNSSNSRMMLSGNFRRSSRKSMTSTRKSLTRRPGMKWMNGQGLLIGMLPSSRSMKALTSQMANYTLQMQAQSLQIREPTSSYRETILWFLSSRNSTINVSKAPRKQTWLQISRSMIQAILVLARKTISLMQSLTL